MQDAKVRVRGKKAQDGKSSELGEYQYRKKERLMLESSPERSQKVKAVRLRNEDFVS